MDSDRHSKPKCLHLEEFAGLYLALLVPGSHRGTLGSGVQGALHWGLSSSPAVLGFSYRKKPGRREYVRVRISAWQEGLPVLERYGKAGAGVLSSVAGAEGLAELDEQTRHLQSGDTVRYIGFAGIYD